MSSGALQQGHLHQRELTGANIKEVLSQLGKWLEKAAFEDDGTLEQCADPGLFQACTPLLVELGIYERVQYNISLNSTYD